MQMQRQTDTHTLFVPYSGADAAVKSQESCFKALLSNKNSTFHSSHNQFYKATHTSSVCIRSSSSSYFSVCFVLFSHFLSWLQFWWNRISLELNELPVTAYVKETAASKPQCSSACEKRIDRYVSTSSLSHAHTQTYSELW